MLLHFDTWQLLAVTLLTFNIGRCLAILCYKCDSVTLPSCATSLDSNSLPTEECKSAFACAMTIVDSVTYRGCSTNTPRGPDYYKTCPESLCNKGVYPPGRLKCHQCSGKDCVAAPTGKPTPCLYFKEIDYCYTDVIDESDAYRGCDSDGSRSPNILAELCEINGCNDEPGVTLLTCSKCDSSDGRGCKMDLFEVNNAPCNITNGTTCSVKSFFGHETETCFLYHNLDRVVRGCTVDSGLLSLDVEHFDVCETELCNKKCLKQQKCIICDSKNDERCKSDPSSLTAATCQSAEASSCSACELSDGTVQRGCGVPTLTEGSRCNQCQEEGCNKLSFTKCYKCTTDESPNCAQWANPNIIGVENCEIAGASCVSAVLRDGKTVRGCESVQLNCNGTQNSCETCSGDLCNAGVFPQTRLQCYYCDGLGECSEVNDERNLRSCARYAKNDRCFEFLSSRGIMVRGCKSDAMLFYECLVAGSGCRLCSGAGCNKMPPRQVAKLRCHKCSKEDEACSWQQGNETLVACQNAVKFPLEESCFIRRFADGSTDRGCKLDEEEQSDSAEEVFLEQTCTKEGCNVNATVIQKCIQCRGNVTEKSVCTTGIEKAEGTLCGRGFVGFEQRGCYAKIDGGFIDRGCAVNLQSSELKMCQSDGGDCHFCHGIECNTINTFTSVTLRNLSTKAKGTSAGLLFLLSLLIFVS